MIESRLTIVNIYQYINVSIPFYPPLYEAEASLDQILMSPLSDLPAHLFPPTS